MSRFFVSPESIHGDNVIIDGKEAHHIVDVMRLSVSDKVVVFDGTGAEYSGIIEKIEKGSVTVHIADVRKAVSGKTRRVTLIQAVPKKDKMDYIVEKATELGVSGIIAVMTSRTIPQWNHDKVCAQLERWRKIAKSAAKQCGRSDLPGIFSANDLGSAADMVKDCGTKLIAALVDEARPIKTVLKDAQKGDIVIAIGPEGDFTPKELALAAEEGFVVVNLGARVLRSDTAGLAAVVMVNYEYQ